MSGVATSWINGDGGFGWDLRCPCRLLSSSGPKPLRPACALPRLRSVMHPEECVGSADKSCVCVSDSFLNVHIVDITAKAAFAAPAYGEGTLFLLLWS